MRTDIECGQDYDEKTVEMLDCEEGFGLLVSSHQSCYHPEVPLSRWKRIEEELEFSDTLQESEDVPVVIDGITLSLYTIREHITNHAWNGGECLPDMDNEGVFFGQCEYAATAVSEMLTRTGKNIPYKGVGRYTSVKWHLRKRGWYTGTSEGCANWTTNEQGHIAHSWVVFNGKIIDPTWWAFGDGETRVYVFDANDPRYVEDDNA